jgi:hypothetical protein
MARTLERFRRRAEPLERGQLTAGRKLRLARPPGDILHVSREHLARVHLQRYFQFIAGIDPLGRFLQHFGAYRGLPEWVTVQFRSGEVFCRDVGRLDAAVEPTGMY